MVLFALVAGVLSDAFDRRRLMLWVQVYFVVVAGLLAVLTAVGPAIAGLLIAAWGVPPVLAFNAACTLFLIGALLSRRREPVTAPVARGRFLPALRAGGRYVRHEPVVRLILLRLAIFVAPATAMWALLLPPST